MANSCSLHRCCRGCRCCSSAFPSADIQQMGSLKNKYAVLFCFFWWHFPQKTGLKNCMWLLLLTNIIFCFFFLFIFFFWSASNWAAFSRLPTLAADRPAVARPSRTAEGAPGIGGLVCAATPFVTAGGKVGGETGSTSDNVSRGSNLSTESMRGNRS